MKLTGMFIAVAGLLLSAGGAMAVPSGKTVELPSPKGKVIFDGTLHAGKGLKCADCHSKPKLFEMKKGGDTMTMAAMNEGKFCGSCHDGKTAFSVKAAADCAKCHQTVSASAAASAPAVAVASAPAGEKPAEAAPKAESTGEYIDDAVITAKVKAAVLKEASLKSLEIKVETYKGTVQLSGFVRSKADIKKATRLAARIKGVKSVKNDMILKGTQ